MKNNWLKYWDNHRNIKINNEKDLLYQVGKTVSSKPIDKYQFDIIVKDLLKELKITAEDNVIDLCCGNGLLTKYIAINAGFVLGIDFSAKMIKNANYYNAGDNIEYVHHDVIKINELTNNIKSKQINKVIIYDAIAYFSSQEFSNILESLNQSLVSNHSILLGNVLLQENKWKFYNTFKRKLNYLINNKILGDSKGLGKWWELNDLQNIINRFNYKMKLIHQDSNLYSAHYRVDILLEN